MTLLLRDPCICQSGKAFKQCCDRFLNQGLFAKTPVQLMRSRFSAFALGGFGEYLLATWVFENNEMPSGLSSSELSLKTTEWVDLNIVSKSQKGNEGFVEFKAFFLCEEHGQTTKHIHHERSKFARINGRWFYVSGEVF